ncbi:hypothetical protein JCM9803A_00170 [Rhodococcus erythropolis]
MIGEALMSGLLHGGHKPEDLLFTTRRADRAQQLTTKYGVKAVETWEGIVKLSGVQLFSGTSRHHAERRSGSEDLFCDLIPHLKSGGNFGAVIGGGHPVAGWAEVRRNATE